MITQNIHVRMDAYGIPPVIHAVEGDTWRYLDIYTDDAAINTSNTAVVAIHRPDDSYYTIEAMPQSLFYHLEMDQALTRPGKVECQLKVSSGDLVISTYTFYVIVEPSTTGLPTEQLGYDIYDLIDAAQQIQNVGLTEEIKQALLDCFEHVAWTDEHGQDYVDALEAALYPPAELVSISAVYTQSGTVYTTDTLDSLKTNLVVTANYSDSTTETVTTYTLSGTLTEGTSVITVSYGGKTTTFNVTVTAPATLSSITAVYTQSGTVYDTDSLDSLKSDLVVTAVYSDSTTQTVASTDYTLSGTLTVGTSTVTVSYGGKTTTFTVTVTEYVEPTPEIVTAINLPSGCYVDTEYVPTSLQYKYQIGVQFLDSNTPGNQLPFAGFNRLPASNTATEEYWHIYFTTGNQNEEKNKQYIRWEVGAYKNSNTTFSTLRTANGINYTSSLITETPFFMTIKDGEQHLRANEAMTEELIKGSFSTVDATVAYTTVNADDPIDSFWLGKVHQAGSRTITEYSGGVKILCFNVFDANDNAIVSMHPAVFENKIGMYDSVRDKFYEAVGTGVTYDE